MYEVITTVFPAALVIFQGYCLQYFLGSFLESRLKSRWNGLYVAALYVVLKMTVFWGISSGYENSKAAVGTLALSIVLLAFPAICFYKAFRPVTAFLVVSFQAVLEISSYVAVILLDKVGAGLLDALNWCAGKGMFMSEKAFVIAVKAGTVGILFLQYMAIALLLYFSLKKIVRDFRETDYGISRAELLFILTPAAVGLLICMLLRIIMMTVEDGIPQMYAAAHHYDDGGGRYPPNAV